MELNLQRKLVFLWLICLLSVADLWAQGVHLGSGLSDPVSSSLLDVESSNLGVLLPRMTLAEIQAISSPAEGLMVYSTTADIICYYNGMAWYGADGDPMTVAIGDAYKGGIVFELDATQRHGKIAANADLNGGSAVTWGCQGTSITSGNGAASATDGLSNTSAIIADCSSADIAAKLCFDYSVSEDGLVYDDWYLPSSGELSTLYLQQDIVGGFNQFAYYWSSTESSSTEGVGIDFILSGTVNLDKDLSSTVIIPGSQEYDHLVRPIRVF